MTLSLFRYDILGNLSSHSICNEAFCHWVSCLKIFCEILSHLPQSDALYLYLNFFSIVYVGGCATLSSFDQLTHRGMATDMKCLEIWHFPPLYQPRDVPLQCKQKVQKIFIGLTCNFWALQLFQMFTGPLFQKILHLLSTAIFANGSWPVSDKLPF